MESIFGSIDVIKILGFGLSGLSLLLMILAYRLLQKLIDKPDPSPSVIALVKLFLFINIGVLVVVGIFSFPIAGRNNQLMESSQKLSTQNQLLVFSSDAHAQLDSIQHTNDPQKINRHLDNVKRISDSIAVTAKTINPELSKEANILKAQVDDVVVKADTRNLMADTAKTKMFKLNAFALQERVEKFVQPVKQDAKAIK